MTANLSIQPELRGCIDAVKLARLRYWGVYGLPDTFSAARCLAALNTSPLARVWMNSTSRLPTRNSTHWISIPSTYILDWRSSRHARIYPLSPNHHPLARSKPLMHNTSTHRLANFITTWLVALAIFVRPCSMVWTHDSWWTRKPPGRVRASHHPRHLYSSRDKLWHWHRAWPTSFARLSLQEISVFCWYIPCRSNPEDQDVSPASYVWPPHSRNPANGVPLIWSHACNPIWSCNPCHPWLQAR